jgi:hypothetical protein
VCSFSSVRVNGRELEPQCYLFNGHTVTSVVHGRTCIALISRARDLSAFAYSLREILGHSK